MTPGPHSASLFSNSITLRRFHARPQIDARDSAVVAPRDDRERAAIRGRWTDGSIGHRLRKRRVVAQRPKARRKSSRSDLQACAARQRVAQQIHFESRGQRPSFANLAR